MQLKFIYYVAIGLMLVLIGLLAAYNRNVKQLWRQSEENTKKAQEIAERNIEMLDDIHESLKRAERFKKRKDYWRNH